MLDIVPQVLTAEEVAKLIAIAESHAFSDGLKTAGAMVRDLKNNLQLTAADEGAKEVNEVVLPALQRHKEFQALVFPRRITPVRLNRYDPGMEYKLHTDDPVMSGRPQVRTDFSMTLFLSDPARYDGGELLVETPLGTEEIKLSAGDAVIYSTHLLHQVQPVTRGTRLAAIAWVQSMIRSEADRIVLHELRAALELVQAKSPGSEETQLLMKTYSNLFKRWAEV